jgi:hypothetical protein
MDENVSELRNNLAFATLPGGLGAFPGIALHVNRIVENRSQKLYQTTGFHAVACSWHLRG